MFNQVLQQLNYPNYIQNGFPILPFIKKAIQISHNNQLILNTVQLLNDLNIDFNSFNRDSLLIIWNKNNIPLSSKIVITFWWGGISHQYQSPLYYTNINLNNLIDFSINIENQLNTCVSSHQIENFQSYLSKIYNGFLGIDNENNFRLNGINTSFFTKILQFHFQGKIKNNFPLPIIADKWSMRGVLADMIQTNYDWNHLFKISYKNNNDFNISFRGSKTSEFEKYWEFITYINNRTVQLSVVFDGIDSFTLEQYIFGWKNDMNNVNNPRVIATQIINNEFTN